MLSKSKIIDDDVLPLEYSLNTFYDRLDKKISK